MLRSANTFAVVTGQQVGLFGGPMYTIYKIITALQLCASLRAQHPGCEFVPVFWLESEDHDFEEANHTWLLDASGALFKAVYEHESEGENGTVAAGPTGAVEFDARIDVLLDKIAKNLPPSDFHEDVIAAAQNALRAAQHSPKHRRVFSRAVSRRGNHI